MEVFAFSRSRGMGARANHLAVQLGRGFDVVAAPAAVAAAGHQRSAGCQPSLDCWLGTFVSASPLDERPAPVPVHKNQRGFTHARSVRQEHFDDANALTVVHAAHDDRVADIRHERSL